MIDDALLVAGHKVSEQEPILIALHGLGHEYDVVVVLLTYIASLSTFQDTHYALMMHETRLDQLNPPT